jgi:hypothetical protein
LSLPAGFFKLNRASFPMYLCCIFLDLLLELSKLFPIGGQCRKLLVGGV